MKKITLLLAFFICLNISLNAQTYPKKENVIRLLTYNTHYCKGGSDPGSIDDYNTRRLASVIEALDPDVVALQELDSAMSDRRRRDLLKQISEFTGLDYQHFFGGLAPINGGKVGPGLLIKKNLKVVKKDIIPLAGDEARSAVRVDFETFSFMGTHLDLNDAKRTQSASTLVSATDYIRKPCFLAGDLNDSHRWSNGESHSPYWPINFLSSAIRKVTPFRAGPTTGLSSIISCSKIIKTRELKSLRHTLSAR